MTGETVVVRTCPGDGLVARTGDVVVLALIDHGSLHAVLDTVHTAAADVPDDRGPRLMALAESLKPPAGGLAAVILGPVPTVVVVGSIECAYLTGTGTQTVTTATHPRSISLPDDVRQVSLRPVGSHIDPEPHSDLRDGVVAAAGLVVEWSLPLSEIGWPSAPEVAQGAPEPPPPSPPPAAPRPAFLALPLRVGEGERDDPPRAPLPLAGDGAPPPAADGGTSVEGIGCAVGHVNRLDARFCAACGRRIQGTINLITGRRPILGLLVFEDGSTYTLDGGYVIGREPDDDPKVTAGQARPIVVADPERTISRVHAEVILDGWDVRIADRGSANGTYVLPPAATQWHPVSSSGLTLTNGSRVAIGRRIFVFEQR